MSGQRVIGKRTSENGCSTYYRLAFDNRGITKQKAGALREACQDVTKAELLGVTVDEKVRVAVCKK
ncbi:MAG: hypothetical protein ACK5OO_06000 [Cyclobacteriaceae bacterium]